MTEDIDERTSFEYRRSLIAGIINAPDEYIEKLYEDYGKSMASSAGGLSAQQQVLQLVVRLEQLSVELLEGKQRAK